MTETKTAAQAEETIEDVRKAAAEADLKKLNEKRDKGLRTFKRGGKDKVYVSDIYELPEIDLDGIAPTSYLAQPEGEVTGNIETQTFSIREERLKGLMFAEPGQALQKGAALKVIKALKPNGVLSQLPFSDKHNNAAAGNEEDLIGMRGYKRKGFILFFNEERMTPVFCFARNCWAAAMVPELADRYPEHREVTNSGYCSYDHMVFVEPQKGRNPSYVGGGMFGGEGVTTSRNAMRG